MLRSGRKNGRPGFSPSGGGRVGGGLPFFLLRSKGSAKARFGKNIPIIFCFLRPVAMQLCRDNSEKRVAIFVFSTICSTFAAVKTKGCLLQPFGCAAENIPLRPDAVNAAGGIVSLLPAFLFFHPRAGRTQASNSFASHLQ